MWLNKLRFSSFLDSLIPLRIADTLHPLLGQIYVDRRGS